MGRPRLYTSAALRQAAYRRRRDEQTVLVDRRSLDLLHQNLDRLRQAVLDAADRGDPAARKCVGGSVQTVVHKLITLFENAGVAQSLPPPSTAAARKERNQPEAK
ncbi:MAG TPA: hypothetical protein VFJ58_13205 [Armatimonadota bacterium]|nr:hypothetical protein [Armatimonadota bacterium]